MDNCEITLEPLLLTAGPITVRPLAETDADHLLRWLNDPRVLEYYGGRDSALTPDSLREEYFDGDARARRCIVEYEGKPVGYIQIYRLDEELCREYQYSHTDWFSFGIDQFIGEPEYWNRKIGRAFLSLVLDHLTHTEGARSVVLDPHDNNPRALRCYEACGFRKIKFLPRHELREGVMEDCWLMEYLPQISP